MMEIYLLRPSNMVGYGKFPCILGWIVLARSSIRMWHTNDCVNWAQMDFC